MTFIQKHYNHFLRFCDPAKFYLVVSLLSVVLILVENIFDSNTYCIGPYSCTLDYSNIFVFLVKIAYIVIWTIILDSLCKTKHKKLAWGLVLFPYILMFVFIALFIMNQ